jgi:hypothetical protein
VIIAFTEDSVRAEVGVDWVTVLADKTVLGWLSFKII